MRDYQLAASCYGLLILSFAPVALGQNAQAPLINQPPGHTPESSVPAPATRAPSSESPKLTKADIREVRTSFESIERMDNLSELTQSRFMREIARSKLKKMENGGVADDVTGEDLALFADELNKIAKDRKDELGKEIDRLRREGKFGEAFWLNVRRRFYTPNRFPGADDFAVRVASAQNAPDAGKITDDLKASQDLRLRYQSAMIMNNSVAQEHAYLGVIYSGVGDNQQWNPAFGFDFYIRDPFDAPEYRGYLEDLNKGLSREYFQWWPGDMFLGIEFFGPKQAKVNGAFATQPSVDSLRIDTVNAITIDGGYFQPLVRVPILGLMGETDYEGSFGLVGRLGVNYYYDGDAATSHRFNYEAGFRLSLIDTCSKGAVSVNPPLYIDFLPYSFYQGDDGTYRPETRIEGRFLLPNANPLARIAPYMFVSAYLSEGREDDVINVGIMGQMSEDGLGNIIGDATRLLTGKKE